jgi:hypothetical protein
MEKLLKNRTIEECTRDAWNEVMLKRYIPFARAIVTLRRLILQYWRDVYNIIPWEKIFIVLFTILMTKIFS